jgi:tetratricopeptide (TPR) repeat protein
MGISETHTPRYLAWLGNLGLVLVSTGLVLGLAEAVLRRTENADMVNGTRPAQMDIARGALVNPITADEERAFRWDGKGNGPLHIRSGNRRMVYELRPGAHPNELISTNSDGFRDREFSREKAKNTFRIAAVGDSITFGWYQRIDQTYSKVLESLLNAHAAPGAAFEVCNMGVGGYNAEQEVALIKDRALRYQPDLLLIQYCENDGNIGADNGLYVHFTRGVTRIGDRLQTAWRRWKGRDQGRYLVESSYRELRDWAGARGIPVLVIVMPTNRGVTDPIARDLSAFQRLGLNTLTLSEAYSAFPKEQLFADTFHPNNLGHRIVAEELLKRLYSDAALAAATRLTGSPPDYAQARLDLRAGFDALQTGSLNAAVEAYGRAVAVVPEYGPHAAFSLTREAVALSATPGWADALPLVQFAVSLDPKRPENHLEMARLLSRSGRQEEALQACRKSISLWQDQPDSVAPGATLAHAYYEMGRLLRDDPEQQLAAFRNALEQGGYLNEPFESLEQYYRERGDPRGCVAEFRRFAEKHPDSLLGRLYLAQALAGAGEPDEAGRMEAAAMEADPQSRLALLTKADFDIRHGKCAHAGEALLAAVRQDPDDCEAYKQLLADTRCAADDGFDAVWTAIGQRFPDRFFPQLFLGQYHLGQRHWPEAHRALARALEQRPGDPSVLAMEYRTCLDEAGSLEEKGRLEEALVLARKTEQALTPAQKEEQAVSNNMELQYMIARLTGQLGDADGEKRIYREKIVANPKFHYAYDLLSDIYKKASDWPGLRQEWETLAPKVPDEVPGWFHLANACEKMKDLAAARNAAERAFALNPQDPVVGDLLMRICAQQARSLLPTARQAACGQEPDWAAARAAAERAVDMAPEYPGIRDLLADIYIQQARPLLETGQEAACAALLDKALRLNGRHPEALYLSACFAEARGDLHLAREIYRDIIMAAYSEDFRPYMLLSQTYDETAGKEAIVAEWQFMVCACPADYLVHYNLGLALDRIGDSAAAREAYRTVLALRPDAPDSLVLPDRIRKN